MAKKKLREFGGKKIKVPKGTKLTPGGPLKKKISGPYQETEFGRTPVRKAAKETMGAKRRIEVFRTY